MLPAFIGRKIRQTQTFSDSGVRIPVTLIEAGPCVVVQIKTAEKDGYTSVQLGLGSKRVKNVSKPVLGHVKKAGVGEQPPRFLSEIRIWDQNVLANEALKVGAKILVDQVFTVGDKISVSGVSKGKGFAGVVKRHGFSGGPRTHGQSDRERAPGSVGQTTTPGRVYKGKRMAGRMGGQQATLTHLSVIAMDSAKNLLTVKGLIPGARGSLVTIHKEKN